MTKKLSTNAFESLRQKAEALLKDRGIETPDSDRDELIRLTHELEVYYIELELQNEELLKTKADLEQARNEYADLYESARVAYLTMDERGVIQRANKAALSLFKGSKGHLSAASADHPGYAWACGLRAQPDR
jgi:PAS domain-containing protein